VFAEQKIAVAMHHRHANTGCRQRVQCIDDVSGKRILRIFEAVVTWPGFEQIAENEQLLGGTRTATEKIQKNAGDTRRLRRQMQIGNEQDHYGDES
jgi:hypothetical protein